MSEQYHHFLLKKPQGKSMSVTLLNSAHQQRSLIDAHLSLQSISYQDIFNS